jgi:hypothetical protein
MSTVTMTLAEETYLGLLIMAVFWAIFSGACVHERQRTASWASSFLAASLVAAYCFGRLL